MKDKMKRVLACFLAAIIACSIIEFPGKVEAAEVPSPELPSFTCASNIMGKITSVELLEKELQIHTTASNQAITLTLVFLKDGGIRIYDREGNNGAFEPNTTCIEDVKIVSHEDKIIAVQGLESNTEVVLDYSKDIWSLCVKKADKGELYVLTAEELLTSYNSDNQREYVSLKGHISSDEKFIGLGERYSGLILNGESYELWNKDCWSQGTDSYVNVPLIHSNKGYSLFFNSYYGAVADMGKSDADTYTLDFAGPDLDFYIWTGTPLENLKSYANLTGTSATIPKWAVGYIAGGTTTGYWDSMDTTDEEGNQVDNSKEVLLRMLQKYEELGTMPTAVFGESGPTRIPEAYDICDEKNVKLLGWWHPDIPWVTWDNQKYDYSFLKNLMKATNDSELPAIYKKDNANQFFVETDSYENEWLKIDYTHENADALVKNNLNTWWSYGLSGLMVDYGEYIEPNMKFANGLYGDEMHNLQAYSYTKTVKEAWDDSEQKGDYLLFARAGAAGSQQYAALFAGDQKATFEGLQQAIQGGISAGTTGFSVWGSDVGGLQGMPTEELYLRWLGFSTFSPLMRSHGSEGCDPWNYDSTEGDTSAQEAFQKYYWLRENLTDAIYSASIQANKDGTPIMQAMALAFPNEDDMFSVEDQYLFCNEILVCPVYTEGATEREVLLPAGTWYNLLSGEKIKSDGTKRTVSAEVDETPAFIQSGTVMPIDISSKTWTLTDSMKNVNTRTKALLVTPAQNGETTTTEWWQDEAEKQVYSSTTNEDSHTISASQGEKAKVLITYGISTSQVVVDGEWLNQLSEKPTGEKSGFYIDEVTNQTIIILPYGTWEEVKIVAEKSWDYAFTANVGGESVSYLNKAFDVYQYSKPATVDAAKAIVGPVEPTDKDSNSSQASYSYFTTQVYGKNSRGGLKPTSIQGGNGKGYTTLTYAVECLENFEAEYEFYGNTGQVFGLAFGAEKGVFPVSLDGNNTNDSGVMLYVESSGKLQVCGAISTATATATGDVTIGKDSTASWYSNIAGAANIYGSITGIDEITQEASVSDTSATFTVCIKVQNKKMTIYEKNHSDMSVTVWLTDQYQGGYVSLISDNWEHGAFKGFRIKNTEWDYSISATLGGQSVAYLNKMFDVYQFANPLTESATQSTVGPVEPSSENSASIYNETKTHFTTLNIGTTAKGGLRPTSVPSSGFTVLTYTKEKMTNFEAEYEIYGNNSQEFGIMFGTDKGEFAVSLDGDNNNDTGVILATREDGKDLFVGGIIDNAKAKVDGATPTIAKNVSSKWFPHFQDVTNVRVQAMFSGLQAVKETVTDSSPTQTFHIKVQGGILTAYEKSAPDVVFSVPLTNAYDGGYLSFIASSASNGAFKSFRIKKLPDYSCDFIKTDISDLSDDFEARHISATIDGTVTNGTIEELWSKDKGGLRPVKEDGGYTLLTLKDKQYRNFYATIDIGAMYEEWQSFGLFFGQQDPAVASSVTTTENGIGYANVRVGFRSNNGSIAACGVLENTVQSIGATAVKFDTGTGWARNSHMKTNPAMEGFNTSTNANVTHTLNIEVIDGIMRLWWSETPDVVWQVEVNDNYRGGYISLWGMQKDESGLKRFSITELPENEYTFAVTDPTELEDAFSATVFDNANGTVTTKKVSESWMVTNTATDHIVGVNKEYRNNALKPFKNKGANNTYLLTLKEELGNNFAMDFTQVYGRVDAGLYLSDNLETEPVSSPSTDSVKVLLSNPKEDGQVYLRIYGAIDIDSATVADSTIIMKNYGLSVNVPFGLSTADYNAKVDRNLRETIHVQVKDRRLTAWVEGYESAKVTVNLTADFNADKLSFFSNGNNQGGFVSMNVDMLPDDATFTSNINFDIQPIGEYTMVTLLTDLDHSSILGTLNFDNTRYEYFGATLNDTQIGVNQGDYVTVGEGIVKLDLRVNPQGEVLNLYFKNLDTSLNYKSMLANDITGYVANQNKVKVVTTREVAQDYTDDFVLDVKDVVRAKVENSTTVEDLRKVLVGANY